MAVPSPEAIASPLVELLTEKLGGHDRSIFVALDGRSGSGKSTIAAAVVDALGVDGDGRPLVTVIEGDDFYSGGSSATWDGRSAAENVAEIFDWRRQHQVLQALRDDGAATWRPFDWGSPDWEADEPPLVAEAVECAATAVVLFEGAYCARPELADLLDVRVLLDVAADVRRAQLLAREGDDYRDDWDRRWSEAEDHYFGSIMTPDRFDLILRRG